MTNVAADLPYRVAFARVPRIGSARAALLEGFFGDLESAWKADAAALARSGLDRGSAEAVLRARASVEPEQEMEQLDRAGVKAFSWNDSGYPARLREIDDHPPVLFVRGSLLPEDEWALAVVGTRRASPYGRQAAEAFSAGLAAHKITVVSGLARGIDAVAHRAALNSGGRTMAVMASGLDVVYPPEHAKLAREISERGALVSDYPLGTQPRSEYFPRRNRILSGISLGVLVVEGDVRSGALITARNALDQNREVFAVPGSIYSPTHRGTNQLIQEGEAKLVADTMDILEELNLTMVSRQMALPEEPAPLDPTEAKLLTVLSNEPSHIDEVQRASGLPIAVVSGSLALLELKGRVRQVGAMNFIRSEGAVMAPRNSPG